MRLSAISGYRRPWSSSSKTQNGYGSLQRIISQVMEVSMTTNGSKSNNVQRERMRETRWRYTPKWTAASSVEIDETNCVKYVQTALRLGFLILDSCNIHFNPDTFHYCNSGCQSLHSRHLQVPPQSSSEPVLNWIAKLDAVCRLHEGKEARTGLLWSRVSDETQLLWQIVCSSPHFHS